MQSRAVNRISILRMILALILCLPLALHAQSRKYLQRKLALTEKFIQENRKKQEMSFGEYELLREQLKIRQNLLYKLKGEINENIQEIAELDALICKMEEDILAVRTSYLKTAKLTYLNLNQRNFWLSLFSSGSISEAYYRLMYYQQFSKYRNQQLEALQRTQRYLMEKSLLLSEKSKRYKELIINHNQESLELKQAQQDQVQLKSQLKNKYAAYQQKKKREKKIVSAVIDKSETNWKPVLSSNAVSTNAFVRSRGQLNWPVQRSRCLVVGNFGKSEDSYGNPITNDGIYIRTQIQEPINSVFAGTVTAVQNLPMGGQMVVVAHGDYRTTYSNLEKVIVRKGEEIKAGQKIGIVYTDTRTGESILQFLIYKIPNTFLNPELWLSQFSRGAE